MEIEGKPVKRERHRDRLSELPEFIIHQIISYLPTEEAARTTVLSKTWLQSYSTSPILSFHEYYFSRLTANRNPFFNFVNNTLLRYTSLNLRILKFKIKVFDVYHKPAYHLLDKSLGVAFHNGVEHLDISVGADIMFSPYTLPDTIFHSPKLLTYLRVDQCKFPQNTSQLRNAITFPFLKTLNLNLAYVDNGMLQKLLSGAPLLEKIVFFRVSGFKQFRITNLGQLKILDIHSGDEEIKIDIEDAPSLRLLKYWGSFKMHCLLEVGSAENLKNIDLYGVSISDSYLKELITKLPSLEELKMKTCNGLERISVVSDSLKHMHFVDCKNLVEAKISAPSLLELDYDGKIVLSLSLYNTPQELMTSIYIAHYGHNQPSNAWFHQLRELFKSVTQARVSFHIYYDYHLGIQFRTALDNGANPLPLEHRSENFMLEMNPSSSFFAVFVDTLFSSSRPTTIAACSLEPANVDFIKFLGGELITATRNPNCCSSARTKCWRHYLKDIKAEVCEEDHDVWQPLHLETSLSEFKFLDKKIRYNLKWYASLNA